MQTRTKLVQLIVLAALFAPVGVQAQCTNLSGNPAPQAEYYAANLVKLKYLPSGPGFGDDKPMLFKSPFTAPTLAFDPLNTHSLHVTFRLNTIGGPVMWSASIPPSTTLWSQIGNKWIFSDPTTTFGVRKIKMFTLPGGFYNITFIKGMNTNITNAPVIPGTDNVHVMVEIESGGVGFCYDGTTSICSGIGSTQKCNVL